MSNQYFMAIFAVKYFDEVKQRPYEKTISSYVSLYDNFERTVDKFAERFAKQNYEIKDITVFISDSNFKDEWEALKEDASVPWSHKNRTLLARRPDIDDQNVFCAEGYKPRNYRK